MDDLATDELFRELRSSDPQHAWATFLEHYSPLLLDVVRLFEREPDAVGDCYVFICEHLSRDRFRRLLHFRPDGPARFSTWLCAVSRNLCLDWHRQQCGRNRVFDSVARLDPLEREVFRCVLVEFLGIEDTLSRLEPRFPGLSSNALDEALVRVRQTLTSRQLWLLSVRRTRGLAWAAPSEDEEDGLAGQVAAGDADPETRAALGEQRAALAVAMARLPAPDRLLLRLRFERDLTLDEIARLLHLGNAQQADRRIRDVVGRLRATLGEPAGAPGKRPVASV